VKGFLLDTNHVAAYCRKDPAIMRIIDALPPDTQIRANVITLGEVEAGHKMNPTTNQRKRDEYTARLNEKFLPEAINISVNTRFYYADLMGRLYRKYPPAKGSIGKNKTERYLLETFGVDINDVWSVAVAWEHGLIFATHDKMERIREVILASEVQFVCWI